MTFYVPRSPTSLNNLEEVRLWMEDELRRIALSVNESTIVNLKPIFRDVDKPRDGMMIYADGTSFNPGSGAGVYERRGGAWHKL